MISADRRRPRMILLDVANLYDPAPTDDFEQLVGNSRLGRNAAPDRPMASAMACPAFHASSAAHVMSEASTSAPWPQRPAARIVASLTAISAQRAMYGAAPLFVGLTIYPADKVFEDGASGIVCPWQDVRRVFDLGIVDLHETCRP